ncbi:MAG: class I SAM-dependent methyltransferase [bacterium]|nr:class I SAM-dependent methyltransferase [bacterium]
MRIGDEAATANERLWDNEVRKGCGFTQPWLDLDVKLLRDGAAGKYEVMPSPLDTLHPPSILSDVDGKDVLCLASGGGQQSAVFGLLGARVTVLDLCRGQLEADRKAAAHYGYDVRTVHGDMRALDDLDDNSFDRVYQPESMCYMPDVAKVFAEVARVLKSGGLYRTVLEDPGLFVVEWDGAHYYLATPYYERVHHRDDGGIEYCHTMADICNGLVDAGLTLQRVYDRPIPPECQTMPPGTWGHQDTYVGGSFIVVARKG